MSNSDGSGYGRNAIVPDEDSRLTHVTFGTPMGELMRRYWQPVCLSSELTDLPKFLRILDEELVAFRDKSGQVGVLGAHCSHRGTSLEYGRIEEDGIRCCYHGWLYDHEGRCLDQPGEPAHSRYKDEIRQPWYPAEEYKGLVFAYMGPLEKKPLLPRYDILEDEGAEYLAYRNYSRGEVAACNWLQLQENAADPVHTQILHGWNPGLFEFSEVMAVPPRFEYVNSDRHVSYIRTSDLDNGHRLTRISTIYVPTARSVPPPEVTGTNPEEETERARMMGWWVPVDNENTVGFHVERIDPGKKIFQPPHQAIVRDYEATQRAPDDWEAQVSQRPIAPRARTSGDLGPRGRDVPPPPARGDRGDGTRRGPARHRPRSRRSSGRDCLPQRSPRAGSERINEDAAPEGGVWRLAFPPFERQVQLPACLSSLDFSTSNGTVYFRFSASAHFAPRMVLI